MAPQEYAWGSRQVHPEEYSVVLGEHTVAPTGACLGARRSTASWPVRVLATPPDALIPRLHDQATRGRRHYPFTVDKVYQ
ncbi:MAG: hypothetical protein PVSMB4_13510 [Ktedonobacterales bacterium]